MPPSACVRSPRGGANMLGQSDVVEVTVVTSRRGRRQNVEKRYAGENRASATTTIRRFVLF
jgi:hypothetical protein